MITTDHSPDDVPFDETGLDRRLRAAADGLTAAVDGRPPGMRPRMSRAVLVGVAILAGAGLALAVRARPPVDEPIEADPTARSTPITSTTVKPAPTTVEELITTDTPPPTPTFFALALEPPEGFSIRTAAAFPGGPSPIDCPHCIPLVIRPTDWAPIGSPHISVSAGINFFAAPADGEVVTAGERDVITFTSQSGEPGLTFEEGELSVLVKWSGYSRDDVLATVGGLVLGEPGEIEATVLPDGAEAIDAGELLVDSVNVVYWDGSRDGRLPLRVEETEEPLTEEHRSRLRTSRPDVVERPNGIGVIKPAHGEHPERLQWWTADGLTVTIDNEAGLDVEQLADMADGVAVVTETDWQAAIAG